MQPIDWWWIKKSRALYVIQNFQNIKVKHHCHFTGLFLKTICTRNNCNVNCKYTRLHKIPIIFHNLSRYDAHLLLEELASTDMGDADVNIVPTTSETYIAFFKKVKKIKFHFLDSCRFKPESLEKIVQFLKMVLTSTAFPD